MTVLGLLLVALAVLLGLAMFLGTAQPQVQLSLGPVDVEMPPAGVFMLGVAAVLILMAGLALLRTALRRSLRNRREQKEARAAVSEPREHDDHLGDTAFGGGTTGTVRPTEPHPDTDGPTR